MGRVTPPRKIFGMHRPHPEAWHRVHQEERVKIRQGEICRERVWLDEFGNELDQVDDHTFRVRPPAPAAKQPPQPVIHGYPEVPLADIELQFVAHPRAAAPHAADLDLALALLLVGTLTLLVLLWFLAGYLLGRRRAQPAWTDATPAPAAAPNPVPAAVTVAAPAEAVEAQA